jgi:hypothetical protein
MGHTLPTITGHHQKFESNLTAFRRALRKSDQIAFDSLMQEIKQHLPAASYAANVLPGVSFLLCMLLEKHKQILAQNAQIQELRRELQREIASLRQDYRLELSKQRTWVFLQEHSEAIYEDA